MEKKESYIVIDGVRYDAVKQEDDALCSCKGCVFNAGDDCTLHKIDGLSIDCGGDHTFVSRGEVAAQQRLTERSKEETDKAEKETDEAEKEPKEAGKETEEDGKAKKTGSIGKRSYYGFPNGVEAEDICRYLPFNLGNVVKYVCRAGRKDPKKKALDLRKAKDYLVDEIKRIEEGDD